MYTAAPSGLTLQYPEATGCIMVSFQPVRYLAPLSYVVQAAVFHTDVGPYDPSLAYETVSVHANLGFSLRLVIYLTIQSTRRRFLQVYEGKELTCRVPRTTRIAHRVMIRVQAVWELQRSMWATGSISLPQLTPGNFQIDVNRYRGYAKYRFERGLNDVLLTVYWSATVKSIGTALSADRTIASKTDDIECHQYATGDIAVSSGVHIW